MKLIGKPVRYSIRHLEQNRLCNSSASQYVVFELFGEMIFTETSEATTGICHHHSSGRDIKVCFKATTLSREECVCVLHTACCL